MARKKLGKLHPVAEKLILRLIDITEGRELKKKLDKYTERDKALAEAVGKVGGCATSHLHELISLLEKRKLPPVKEDPSEAGIFHKGTVIVLHGNTNGHDYPKDGKTPVMVWDGKQGLRPDVRTGNYLPLDSEEEFARNGRKATPAEVREYVEALFPRIAVATDDGSLVLKGEYGDTFFKFAKEVGAL